MSVLARQRRAEWLGSALVIMHGESSLNAQGHICKPLLPSNLLNAAMQPKGLTDQDDTEQSHAHMVSHLQQHEAP